MFRKLTGKKNSSTKKKMSIKKLDKGKKNFLSSFIRIFLEKEKKRAFNHTINHMYRNHSDCLPFCPKIDVWKYEYNYNGKLISSPKPISSQKKYWKNKYEARVISVTLFGNDSKYLEGIKKFIFSMDEIMTRNNISDPLWGYKSFIIRIYVAFRNPKNSMKLPIINSTSTHIIKELLNLGCELAYVDNHLDKVGKDATFWRFMIAAEEMKPNERIRYLIRDVDWIISASEYFSFGEWLNSNYQFHRPHLYPFCFGPLVACLINGTHTGKGPFYNLKEKMENFPYRNSYGDDELFTRDVLWVMMKYIGSVMTHVYKKDYVFHVMNPREDTCQDRPSQPFCNTIQKLNLNKKSSTYYYTNSCTDIYMPEKLKFPYLEIFNSDDETINNKFMKFDLNDERQENAVKALYNNNIPSLEKK